MRTARALPAAVLFFALCTWPSGSVAQSQQSAGLRVWAPVGATHADIGRLYDAHFQPVRGVAFEGEAAVAAAAETYRERVESVSTAELRAQARFPAVGGSINLQVGESLGYVRAVSLRRVVRVPPTVPVQAVPGAAYFVSEIHFGYAYEMRVEGNSLGVAATVRGIAAGVSAAATETSVRVTGATRGLRPRGDNLAAMAADSPEDILERFEAEGEPHALFFVLERLPTDARSVVSNVTVEEPSPTAMEATYEIHALNIAFPPRNNARNAGWDPIGGPDMVVDVYSGSRFVRRIAAPRDAYTYEFGSAPVGEHLTVSPGVPLRFVFFDADVASHDSAGEAQLTRLPDGDVRVTTPYGAQLMIRVRTVVP